MRCNFWCLCCAVAVFSWPTTQSITVVIADDQSSIVATTKQESAWRRRIHEGLDRIVTVDFRETKLSDAMAFLADQARIPIVIDRHGLEDVGLDPETPITISVGKVSTRSVLRLMLGRLDLTSMPRDGVLLITTPEAAESTLLSEVINVHDLIQLDARETGLASGDYDSLIELITSTIEPVMWDEVGGPGSIRGFRGALVISQTHDVLRQVHDLLKSLRAAVAVAAEHRDAPPPATSMRIHRARPAAKSIDAALGKSFDCDFTETPLADVAEFLSDIAKIHVMIDRPAIEDIGVDCDSPVSFSAKQIQLRFALKHLLRELDLTYMIRDEVLLITTPEVCECGLETRLYPAADLVARARMSGLFPDNATNGDLDCLIDLITTTIQPDSWDAVGGPGAVANFPAGDLLVISQTSMAHDEIETLLAKLRSHLDAVKKSPPASAKNELGNSSTTRLVVYHVPSRPHTADNMRSDASTGRKKTSDSSMILPSAKGRSSVVAQFGVPVETQNTFDGLNDEVIPEDRLLDLIKELVAPDQWQGKEVFAKDVPGRLLIRQTPKIHRQIEQLLTHLGIRYHLSPGGTCQYCGGHRSYGTGFGGGFGGGGGGFGGGAGGGGFFSLPAEK